MVEQEILDLKLARNNNSLQLIFEDVDMQEVQCTNSTKISICLQ